MVREQSPESLQGEERGGKLCVCLLQNSCNQKILQLEHFFPDFFPFFCKKEVSLFQFFVYCLFGLFFVVV